MIMKTLLQFNHVPYFLFHIYKLEKASVSSDPAMGPDCVGGSHVESCLPLYAEYTHRGLWALCVSLNRESYLKNIIYSVFRAYWWTNASQTKSTAHNCNTFSGSGPRVGGGISCVCISRQTWGFSQVVILSIKSKNQRMRRGAGLLVSVRWDINESRGCS